MAEFTPEKPPKSGAAKKLWDWWIKHTGKPPDHLCVKYPGWPARSRGEANYSWLVNFEDGAGHKLYVMYDAAEVLKITKEQTPDDAVFSRAEWAYSWDYLP